MSAKDVLILCELSGGPGCGGTVQLPQQAAEIYLLKFAVPGRWPMREVWSYQFANRCAKSGAWVLEAVSRVGYQNAYGEEAK